MSTAQHTPTVFGPDDSEQSLAALPGRLRGRADWLEKRGRVKDCELLREAAICVQELNRIRRANIAKSAGSAAS